MMALIGAVVMASPSYGIDVVALAFCCHPGGGPRASAFPPPAAAHGPDDDAAALQRER